MMMNLQMDNRPYQQIIDNQVVTNREDTLVSNRTNGGSPNGNGKRPKGTYLLLVIKVIKRSGDI